MDHADDELQTFKTTINLVEYAGSIGYILDPKKSCKTSAVMLHPNGDKVVIARRENKHWTYFAVGDSTDNGTIVDFCQRRTGINLGHVRKALREFTGAAPLPRQSPEIRELEPVARDILAIRTRFERMRTLDGHHRYLKERCIPTALLTSARFAGTVHVDDRQNAVFAHTDNNRQVTGWEVKNSDGFSGFASGGTKSLWRSTFDECDQRLVIAESAIDALSYAALFPCGRTRYASIAGRMNDVVQPALLTSIIQNMRDGRKVVAAMDNDDAGRELGDQIKSLCLAAGCPQIDFGFHRPRTPGKDFNDVLRQYRAKEQLPGLER